MSEARLQRVGPLAEENEGQHVRRIVAILDAAFEGIATAAAILGLLILIRTFLSWSLEVEIDGRWPWQRAAPEP